MVDAKQTDIASTGSASDVNGDFVLKHRVAGAAFLLFFGALVLPWLLGPPSAASKTTAAQTIDANSGQISSAEIENEMLDELENSVDVEPEQVYISKITPLDAARLEEERRRAEAEKKSTSSAAVMAMADVGESAVRDKSDIGNKKSDKKDAVANQGSGDKVGATKDTKSAKDVKKVVKKTEKTTNNIASEANKKVEGQKSDSRENALAAALAAETENSAVDVGWVVQVGVFTDKKGADRVVKDLKTKGFKPSATVVETNQGMGTRVWLGPFSQRVDAAKTKTRLKDRTGEDGFLRAYP